MASKLKEGGGTIGSSKPALGFSLPPPGKAKSPAMPSKPAAPVLPPPTAVSKAKAKAAVAAEEASASEVRLWISKLPTDQTIENQELLDYVKKLAADAGADGHVEIDHRRDMTKEWVSVTVYSQDAADALVQCSKDRKVSLRGKPLKIEYDKQKPPVNRRPNNATGKGGDDGDAKAAGDRGQRRGKGKGGNEGGGKGGSSEKERSADGSRSKGGRKGEKGGEKGSWQAKS